MIVMPIPIRRTFADAVLRTIIGGKFFAPTVVSSPAQTPPYTTVNSSQRQTAPLNLRTAIIKIKDLSGCGNRYGTDILFRPDIEGAYQSCGLDPLKLNEFIEVMGFVLNSNPQSKLEAMQWGRYRLSEAQEQLQQLS